MHADLKARDSLALDLMEAIRPEMDAWLLDALTTRTFRKADFFETREGNCRLMPPLTRAMAETAPHWGAALNPVVGQAARLLASSVNRTVRVPTPLTDANRRAGKANQRHTPLCSSVPAARLPAACHQCGALLDHADRLYCGECHPERHAEQSAAWASAGQEALAQLRETGMDPAHSAVAGQKRGRRNALHNAAAAAWKREGNEGTDQMDFAQDVLPRLQSVPLREMSQATGLSQAHCSFVRRGLRMPHPRHWPALERLTRKPS